MKYSEAIRAALFQAMKTNDRVLCYGLGVNDPKSIFGTTLGLEAEFGSHRVFDMPTSENAMTGIAIGAALGGWVPIMVHQRVDFFLLALDQLVNSAAKWYYMFGGQANIPMVIRLVIGRGWGQGPTHSQSLHSWFAHIPGLKVVMPSSAYDAKGLLTSSINDGNPIIFMEHRWLHNLEGNVPKEDYSIPIGKAKVVTEGKDITIVANSYMTIEANQAIRSLKNQGISCELIDLRTIRPIDWQTIELSVAKTGRLLTLDTGAPICSIGSEITAHISEKMFDSLKSPPKRLSLPDHAIPTSVALTEHLYPGPQEIIESVCSMVGGQITNTSFYDLQETAMHDVPGEWFKGPF